jgi:hypothetical protein
MEKIKKFTAKKKVANTVNICNSPNTKFVMLKSFELGEKVFVWKEKNGWKGPFKVITVANNEITVKAVNGPAIFKSTGVKRYSRTPKPIIKKTNDP